MTKDFRETRLHGWGVVSAGFRTKDDTPDRAELLVGGLSIILERAEFDILATAIRKWLDSGDHT